MRPPVRRVALVLLLVAAGTVLPAGPAAAHSVEGTGATDLRATVTDLSPAVPGVTLAAVEGGGRLQVRNDTAVAVVVAGDQGEPWLRVGPDGTFVNANSPTGHLDRGQEPPAGLDASRTPEWQRISGDRFHRWTDHRMRRILDTPPPAVAVAPDRPHRLTTWTVRLTHGGSALTAAVTLDWVPGPSPWAWLAAAALLAVAVGALGLLRRPHRWLAAATAALVTADVLHSVAFALAVGADLPTRLGVLALQLMLWPFAAVVTVLLLRRLTGAVWLAAVVGAATVLTSGGSDLPLLWRSSAPSALPLAVDRVTVVVLVGAGLGLAGTVLGVIARERRQGWHPVSTTST